MNVLRLFGALLLMVGGAPLFAHTHLEKSVPAEGSHLTAAPANFVLTFAKPVQLTALHLQQDGAAAQPVGPLPTSAQTRISVPAPKLPDGSYVLSWRAVGSDGHVMSGKLSFTVHAATS